MTKKYDVQWDYASVNGSFREGSVIECSEEEAAWYNRDSPGVLVPHDEGSPDKVEGRAMEGPPQDRMFRGDDVKGRAESEDVEGSEVDATDAARDLAEEHGIALSEVKGTGVDGRVLVGDIEALIE